MVSAPAPPGVGVFPRRRRRARPPREAKQKINEQTDDKYNKTRKHKFEHEARQHFSERRLLQQCLETRWSQNVFEGKIIADVLQRAMLQHVFERGTPEDVLDTFFRM